MRSKSVNEFIKNEIKSVKTDRRIINNGRKVMKTPHVRWQWQVKSYYVACLQGFNILQMVDMADDSKINVIIRF